MVDGQAYSVFVFKNDVYVAGVEKNSNGFRVATLWKNKNPQKLGSENRDSFAYAVFAR